ncbi:cation transport ATPase [Rhodococcus sp. AW25M09]|uniref:cation-translocating P-type ATPase n=1 Tax=Rhodococcus sp. AW25M09 TaxID=1268303 RepID=UPI0002ABC91D|nr:cation-transporting P-type ATPase [Rhodococcus sp. AW25M09]CCQ13540.1 cation transport ATPase [Rhodococcus sp. AW25M09]
MNSVRLDRHHTEEAPDDDANRSVAELFRDLRTGEQGLDDAEGVRRLSTYGPNVLTRSHERRWPKELLTQFTQPLAVLLALAAVLAWIGGTHALSYAVVAVIVLNAAFAFVQEMQAEKAVEALSKFLPAAARVIRGGVQWEIAAAQVVPGDLLVVSEGDKISADGRIIDGELTVDLSALTGESMPVQRSTDAGDVGVPRLEASDLVFSGTTCVGGDARVVATRTGMHTELGRIASLSQRPSTGKSPLERQVTHATLIIAVVAVAVGAAFLPIGLVAGLGWAAAISFSIGLIVANVPEGLLPTITLALAAGVRQLAARGAVVKRLSAVETLGSVTVICTDKTGTLTENRMQVTQLWLPSGPVNPNVAQRNAGAVMLVTSGAACTTAERATGVRASPLGDPTEIALLNLAAVLGVDVSPDQRAANRIEAFGFDSHLKRMTTVDTGPDGPVIHTKGALETVLPLCTHLGGGDGVPVPLDDFLRQAFSDSLDRYARQGLRVLAVAERAIETGQEVPTRREDAETGLGIVGLVAMADPVRDGVADAVRDAHRAGIRIHVVTGDNGLTASTIARQVGIGTAAGRIVDGGALDNATDRELTAILSGDDEIVFARSSPEAKLRIAQALRSAGEIVAMTGDGVNDAPALRHADIGIAMGRSGTDVAREAATVVLTDDNFATIVTAVSAGRQVYDNVRKFVLYIFAHAVPEVVPFLVFAVSGGAIPLPLTVLQILAIDLGTETLPALALGREPAEPGLMDRRPRRQTSPIIDRALLFRAWLILGAPSAVLVMMGFAFTLHRAGWTFGDPTGVGDPLHHAYMQATTMTFAGIVACQIGVAFAARTGRASLRSIGLLSNRPLLWGIAFELAFTAAVIYAPPLQYIFGTAALGPAQLVVLVPFPFIIWGIDEGVRSIRRRHTERSTVTSKSVGEVVAGQGPPRPV